MSHDLILLPNMSLPTSNLLQGLSFVKSSNKLYGESEPTPEAPDVEDSPEVYHILPSKISHKTRLKSILITNNNTNSRIKKKKKVSFDNKTKKEDGFTAKLYSSASYLERDGMFLRPKSDERIEREKRLLRMLNAPESLAGLNLPEGLLEDNENEIYNPEIPNNYEIFANARKQFKEWLNERQQKHEFAAQRAIELELQTEQMLKKHENKNDNNNNEIYNDNNRERERERDRDRDYHNRDRDRNKYNRYNNRSRSRSRERDNRRYRDRSRDRDHNRKKDRRDRDRDRDNNNRNNDDNNNKPIKKTGMMKAMEMLQKHGWKKGEGLGRQKQGLKGCLVPIGGFNTLVSVQDPTTILRLQNLSDKGKVDEHLEVEVVNECRKYGNILNSCVFESNNINLPSEQQVSVFVKFDNINSCQAGILCVFVFIVFIIVINCCIYLLQKAIQDFHGRFFAERRVIASFFPEDRYQVKDFD